LQFSFFQFAAFCNFLTPLASDSTSTMPSPQSFNTLITGGAGFIGSHLVERLLADRANRVTVVDNFDPFYDPATKRANLAAHLNDPNFGLVEADICDPDAVDALFSRSGFDCVVHLAARAGVRPSLENPLAYEETNVRGTYALLEAARRHSAPQFIFGSSSSVYGLTSKVPFHEADPLAWPISPYAATKIAGEAACRVYSHLFDMRVVCLRFFTVYGPRQRPDLAIHKFARLISESRPIPVFGDGSSERDYTYVDDIVAGVLAAMRYDASGFEVINLGASETVKLSRVISLIEAALGLRAVLDRQPDRAEDVPVTYADISKARRLLGYDPKTNIESGLEAFVAWLRAVGVSRQTLRG
jgi:UDP-glucuronate 4-epimerase